VESGRERSGIQLTSTVSGSGAEVANGNGRSTRRAVRHMMSWGHLR